MSLTVDLRIETSYAEILVLQNEFEVRAVEHILLAE